MNLSLACGGEAEVVRCQSHVLLLNKSWSFTVSVCVGFWSPRQTGMVGTSQTTQGSVGGEGLGGQEREQLSDHGKNYPKPAHRTIKCHATFGQMRLI